jgi:hypothetical protein
LGALIYEMLVGKPAFEGTAFGTLLVQIITQAPLPIGPLSASGEALPKGLSNLVLRCLEKEPAKRPQTMAELGRLLLPYADPAGLRKARRREWEARLLTAVGALALVLGGFFWVPWSEVTRVSSFAVASLDPRVVKLTVNTTPRGARVIRTDTGQQLGITPYLGRLPLENLELPLRLELDGFQLEDRRVRLDTDTALEVALEASKGPLGRSESNRLARDAVVDPFTQ